jgi:hypothetical protein
MAPTSSMCVCTLTVCLQCLSTCPSDTDCQMERSACLQDFLHYMTLARSTGDLKQYLIALHKPSRCCVVARPTSLPACSVLSYSSLLLAEPGLLFSPTHCPACDSPTVTSPGSKTERFVRLLCGRVCPPDCATRFQTLLLCISYSVTFQQGLL